MAQYVKTTTAPQARAGQTRGVALKKAKTKRRVKSSDLKMVVMILVVFLVSVGFINQYSKIINVSSQINSLEQEVKDTDMLIDILEGKVINMINWDEIEQTAKEKLDMVEPDKNDYSAIELKELPNDYESINASTEQEEITQSKLSMLIDYLSN
jgi:cell division protein FtsL